MILGICMIAAGAAFIAFEIWIIAKYEVNVYMVVVDFILALIPIAMGIFFILYGGG